MIHRAIELLFYFTIVAVAFYFLTAEIDKWAGAINGFYQIEKGTDYE